MVLVGLVLVLVLASLVLVLVLVLVLARPVLVNINDRMCVGGVPNIWGRWFPAPLDGDMAPRNTPFPMCFHFDRYR